MIKIINFNLHVKSDFYLFKDKNCSNCNLNDDV